MIVEIDPRSPMPPYEQLREQITMMITRGTLEAGSRLPPIRQLAADLELAPGTVARSYRELEADGLVVARGRRGTRVTGRADWSAAVDDGEAERRLADGAARYAALARQLGVSAGRARAAVDQAFEAARATPDRTSPAG